MRKFSETDITWHFPEDNSPRLLATAPELGTRELGGRLIEASAYIDLGRGDGVRIFRVAVNTDLSAGANKKDWNLILGTFLADQSLPSTFFNANGFRLDATIDFLKVKNEPATTTAVRLFVVFLDIFGFVDWDHLLPPKVVSRDYYRNREGRMSFGSLLAEKLYPEAPPARKNTKKK